jgi:hypothetical protein
VASAFEFFDDYILDTPEDLVFREDPDYIDVSLSLALLEPLTPETASKIFTALAARGPLLTHLAIPEVYESFRHRGIDEIFRRDYEWWDDYFELEVTRLSLGSFDVDIRIKLSFKGKKAAKEHPHRLLRALLSSFVTVITIWSGLITIDAQGAAISVPPPTTSVISACEQYAPIPSVVGARVKIELRANSGVTVCTIQLTEPTTASPSAG